MHEEISKVRRACMALDDQLQRKPTSWEVAAKLGWTVERVELAMSAAKVDASAGELWYTLSNKPTHTHMHTHFL